MESPATGSASHTHTCGSPRFACERLRLPGCTPLSYVIPSPLDPGCRRPADSSTHLEGGSSRPGGGATALEGTMPFLVPFAAAATPGIGTGASVFYPVWEVASSSVGSCSEEEACGPHPSPQQYRSCQSEPSSALWGTSSPAGPEPRQRQQLRLGFLQSRCPVQTQVGD